VGSYGGAALQLVLSVIVLVLLFLRGHISYPQHISGDPDPLTKGAFAKWVAYHLVKNDTGTCKFSHGKL
jgi:hypothetical protein